MGHRKGMIYEKISTVERSACFGIINSIDLHDNDLH